jgi:hypothetical protein
MGYGTSIFLIAVGAIMRFAVRDSISGVNLDMVGLILMLAGVAVLILTLLWTLIWADRRRADREVMVERDPGDPRYR